MVKLVDAAYIPAAPFTLISIPRLWQGGCRSQFHAGGRFWDFFCRGVHIIRADVSSGLPVVQTSSALAAAPRAAGPSLALPVFAAPDEDDDHKHEDHAARIAATREDSDDDQPELLPASDSDLESDPDSDDEFVPPPKSTVPVSDAVGGATTSVGSARIDLLYRRLGHLSESGLHLLRHRGCGSRLTLLTLAQILTSCIVTTQFTYRYVMANIAGHNLALVHRYPTVTISLPAGYVMAVRCSGYHILTGWLIIGRS